MTLAWPKALIGAALLTAGLLFAAPTARGQTPPPETPTVTSTETPTPTPTPTPEGTSPPPPTPTSTPTATPTPEGTSIPTETATATPTPTATLMPTPTATLAPGQIEVTEVAFDFAGRVNPRVLPKPARRREDRRQIPLRTPGGSPPPGAVPLTSVIDPSAGNPPPASVSSPSTGSVQSTMWSVCTRRTPSSPSAPAT